jgi:ABC-type multidrug transport system ATPase subunit
MQITLADAGKRYRFDWIFRRLDHTFQPETVSAILGPNGSGKSTLLKVLAGQVSLSKGKIEWSIANAPVAPDRVYRQVSYAAPYIELIEELTLQEAIDLHHRLKPLSPDLDPAGLLHLIELEHARDKQIRYFSSGMKQRLKLGLAICSQSPFVLLDEPTTNLDVQATAWFHRLLEQRKAGKTVIIATNDPADLALCTDQLLITQYKTR